MWRYSDEDSENLINDVRFGGKCIHLLFLLGDNPSVLLNGLMLGHHWNQRWSVSTMPYFVVGLSYFYDEGEYICKAAYLY